MVPDETVEEATLGIGMHQMFVCLLGNFEVLINGTASELDFERLVLSRVPNRGETR
jgi:hypothetical protein